MVRGIDRGYVTRYDLIEYQRKILEQNQIKNQFYISPGATDATNVHLHDIGVPTLQACLIARNINTISGIIDLDDFENTIAMVKSIVSDLNENKIKMFNWSKE